MHHEILPLVFADLFGLSIAQLTGILIPIAGIVLAGVIVVSGMYFHNRRREMWHETARIALEKGQPVPPLDPADREDEHEDARRGPTHHDIRGGMILIAVGAGLWLMFGSLAEKLRFIGAIPAFIGVALLLYALLAKIFGPKNPPQNPPPRS
jgi:Domain of unknown function (DUF6249)